MHIGKRLSEFLPRPWGLLLVALLCGTGCSSVKLAYNNLDRISRWALSDYIGLDEAQRRYFDAATAELLYWHRTEHLPRYADFAEAVDAQLADGTSPAEIDAIVDAVLGWAAEIEDRGLPIAAELLMSLSDPQVEELALALEEGNREWAEPEMGLEPEAARAVWQREFGARFARFSGRLTRAQRDYLVAQSVRYVPERVAWADYRRRWQADLLRLLARRDDMERFEADFRVLVRQRRAYLGADLAAVSERNNVLAGETSAWLINHLTPRQRERFSARLQSLATDFRALAREPAAPPPQRACLLSC